MNLVIERLHFIIAHIPGIIECFVFLIGTLLIVIPILQILIHTDKSTYKKASKVCLDIMGLAHLTSTKSFIEISTLETSNMPASPIWRRSALPSAGSLTSESIVSEAVDTKVCFSPDISTSMVAGLVNTGNSCFLNSVLQSLSSLPKLQAYLNQVSSKYSKNQSLPVTRSLLKTLRLLTTPTERAFRPSDIVAALSNNDRVINRQQQDAQELYQLLINELENESQKQKSKQGLRDLLPFGQDSSNLIENPLSGLLAYRITCKKCNYSSGIPLQSFNNVQLTLPHAASTTLDECLQQLTSIETLEDVECSKCSLVKTLQDINSELESFNHQPEKTEKLNCLQKCKQEMEHRLQAGQIEQDDNEDANFKGLLRTSIGTKTKQSMFAKPPKVLCLHFVRSIYSFKGELSKNLCRVNFPQVLDLSPYCTNGTLNTQHDSPISTPNTSITTKYRLMSTIVHFGDHVSGHYIAYKRRIFADQCHCERCGQEDSIDTKLKPHDSEWFKISDDTVTPCQTEDALAENPFMLMYELIDEDDDAPPTLHTEASTVINRNCLKVGKQYAQLETSSNLGTAQGLQEQENIDLYLSSTLSPTPPSPPLCSAVPTPLPPSSPLLSTAPYTKPKRHNNVNNAIRRLNIRNPPPIAILSQ